MNLSVFNYVPSHNKIVLGDYHVQKSDGEIRAPWADSRQAIDQRFFLE